MDKMRMESVDMTAQNIDKIAELFPNCITETIGEDGKPKKAVNFEVLQQMLSDVVLDGDEAYEFTWVGKKASIVEANKPIRKTLRPCPEESVNWDTTENLYIEGDNLEVLKLLQESYLNKVKMIYIDPPYNTGNDFIYNDDFKMDADEYEEATGSVDESGNRMFKNTDSNGRFHSDWCSMIYSRLMVARNLLADDGVIFISIDDNEQENLRKICDELFGSQNFVAMITIIVKTEGRRYGGFAKTHEQALVYAKNIENLTLNEIEVEGKKFQFNDKKGGFNVQDLRNQNARAFNSTNRPNLRYPFYVDENDQDENGFCKVYLVKESGLTEVYPIVVNGYESVWRWGKKEKATSNIDDLVARKGSDGIIRIYQKMRRLTEMPKTVLIDKDFISIKGTRELQDLLGIGVFDFPKPSKLIKLFTSIATDQTSIVLDFFSGSATTAHAVMQLNAEDGGHRKFIMVQLPEPCDEKSEAYKAGYKNICEIGKERIRRAGAKIKEENPNAADLDTGFRVLKLDTSNMEDVYYTPLEFTAQDLFNENVKADRTNEDLLFQVMLDLGIELSAKIETKQIAGKHIYMVDDNYLVACFDRDVNETTITEIAKQHPVYFVMRDASAANDRYVLGDSGMMNFEQIFKHYSPGTNCRII